MADDKDRKDSGSGEPKDKGSDEGGLGNLPPLSDFDSGGFQSDSALPPLGSLDSDSSKPSAGGLPPIDDLAVETPRPTGGNVRPEPPGFEMADAEFESPSFETPSSKAPKKGRPGFQDPAADSDFSPETPEIGPGPDSDMDTPMFDSAFGGGGGGGGFTPAFDTPAPTQAMETPMFGGPKPGKPAETPTFDDGAFMPGQGPDAGTPAPDFSPDTALGPKPPPMTPDAERKREPAAAAGGAKGILTTLIAAAICLIVGVGVGPFLSTKLTFIPNPLVSVINQKDSDIAMLNKTINDMQKLPAGEGPKVSPEKLAEMVEQQTALTASINDLAAKEQTAKGALDKTKGELDQVRSDLEAKNEEFVKAQDAFEDLQNQTAIVQARQMGLVAEVERLTGQVGTLEDANVRSLASKDALLASVERLLVAIKEGIPLTPDRFARDKRIAGIEELRAKVASAKWVTPELLDAYTSLYKQELDIAALTEYFFAKIPVTNRLGIGEQKWAECLMKGNWAVYYRTLDGKNIGSYENTAEAGATPDYGFREDLPDKIQKQIESEVVASRGPGYEVRLRALAEKQSILEGETTSMQRVFSSL